MDKTVVEKQAKEILDKFARALERVASDKVRPSFVERADFVREEGGGKPCEGFKQSLLENAIDYTSRGGSVFVTIEMKPPFFEISVRDNGIGIPKDQLSLVFKKFFRAPNAVTEKPNGTGLGLFISKNIIEEHGVKMFVDPKTADHMKGTEIDYLETLQQSGFKINNPNAKASCGCGKSHS